MFGISALMQERIEEERRRKESTGNMHKHRLSGTLSKEQSCLVIEMEAFYSVLPTNDATCQLIHTLWEETGFLGGDLFFLKSNRDLIEVHLQSNCCARCCKTFTQCTCKHTEVLSHNMCKRILTALKQLRDAEKLICMRFHTNGLCTCKQKDKEMIKNVSLWIGLGLGISIYAKDYHLKPPPE